MKRVLLIRRQRKGTFDGTDNYCQGLYQLLGDDASCKVLPVPDIPERYSRLFHFSYDEDVLRRYIEQADIVHVNGYTDQGQIDALRLAHELNKKVVYTAHWHPFNCLGHPILGKLFFDLKMKSAIKKYADVVVTINKEDTSFFQSFHDRVVMIPHWNISKSPTTHSSKNPRMLLFVGRINDQVKNFEQLLDIEEGRYEIHCVGKGEMPVKRNDIIQHVNIPEEELMSLYRQASLLVIPSKYEAFSFVALEAMSQGTPVVMSDRVRIADHLDGISGYYVYKYGDSYDFLQKIEHAVGSVVDVGSVINRFNPQIIMDRYRAMYLSL